MDTIRQLATPALLREWVIEALIESAHRRAVLPLRRSLDISPEIGAIGMMPGFLSSIDSAGVKLVSLTPPENRLGSSHLGLIILYDAKGLVPIALLDGSEITALRTAAASAVATDHLARHDATNLTIIGTGEQALSHANALAAIRPLQQITIWGRSHENAARLAEKLAIPDVKIRTATSVVEALESADIVCTVTASADPILPGKVVPAGCHVNLVGSSHAGARETDSELLSKSRIFVDYEPSARAQAGEVLHAVKNGEYDWNQIQGELGFVLDGSIPGRQRDSDVTVFKSLGIASEDIITARKIYEIAKSKGLTQFVLL